MQKTHTGRQICIARAERASICECRGSGTKYSNTAVCNKERRPDGKEGQRLTASAGLAVASQGKKILQGEVGQQPVVSRAGIYRG